MDSSHVGNDVKAAAKSKKEKRLEKKREKELKRIAKEQKQIMDCLEREQAFGKESALRDNWTTLCESLKCTEMIEQMKTVSLEMDGDFDRRNHTIKVLQEDRLKAEEHHNISLQNISDLIDCFMGKIRRLTFYKIFNFSNRFQRYLNCSARALVVLMKKSEKISFETSSKKHPHENSS
jgi:hypothetical protein